MSGNVSTESHVFLKVLFIVFISVTGLLFRFQKYEANELSENCAAVRNGFFVNWRVPKVCGLFEYSTINHLNILLK